jgi:hypothetical protein
MAPMRFHAMKEFHHNYLCDSFYVDLNVGFLQTSMMTSSKGLSGLNYHFLNGIYLSCVIYTGVGPDILQYCIWYELLAFGDVSMIM